MTNMKTQFPHLHRKYEHALKTVNYNYPEFATSEFQAKSTRLQEWFLLCLHIHWIQPRV